MDNKEIWADRFEEQFPNVMQIVITDKPGHEDRNIKGKVMDFIRKALSAQQEEFNKTLEAEKKRRKEEKCLTAEINYDAGQKAEQRRVLDWVENNACNDFKEREDFVYVNDLLAEIRGDK